MTNSRTHADFEPLRPACRDIQRFLRGLGMVCGWFLPDGTCLDVESAPPDNRRQREYLTQRVRDSIHRTAGDSIEDQAELPAGAPEVWIIPVGHRQTRLLLSVWRDEFVCRPPAAALTAGGGQGHDRIGGPSVAAMRPDAQPAGDREWRALLERICETTFAEHETRRQLEAVTQSLSQSYEELALLHRISDRLIVTQEPGPFFRRLCGDLLEVLEVEKLAAFWIDSADADGAAPRVAEAGEPALDADDHDQLWRRIRQDIHRPTQILWDSRRDGPPGDDSSWRLRNLAAVPIWRSRRLQGALVAMNTVSKPEFDSLDTKLLMSVANESAVYLDNFRLYQDHQNLLLGALHALTNSIDAKDPYTSGHSERVALIARWLARQLALGEEDVQNIYLAGLLHDVGKIGVSEAVLRKPGKLVEQEFRQICLHPQIGAHILGSIKQMQSVTPAILSHHEHFDGSGYPQGLLGADIPLGGRIVMLADSFDAMTSDRTYRRALPRVMALAEIRRFSGTQFDPQLAEVFLHGDIDRLARQLDVVKLNQSQRGYVYADLPN